MGGRRGSRTQRKHFKQSRENVWKRPKTESSSDPNNPNSNNPAWQPFATQNPSFDEYYKEQGIVSPEEWDAFMEMLRKPLPAAFRINATSQFCEDIRSQLENDFMKSLQAEAIEGGDLEPIKPLPWYPDNLAWQSNFSRMQLRKNQTLERFHEFLKLETEIGNISRQEAVSMVPPLFLDVRPDHFVLDVCAAPGSKTFQLLEIIHHSAKGRFLPDGMVLANDLDVQRCNLLIHQTKRMCTANLIVTNHEGQHFPGCRSHKNISNGSETTNNLEQSITQLLFDRVLCDVPCSGDGTLRKAPDIWRKWNGGMGNGLHCLQIHIAMRGLSLLKVGGRMVYSTCSMNPVENEAVVAEVADKMFILRRCGGSVELVDVSNELPQLIRRPGLTKWKVLRVHQIRDKGVWLPSYKDARKLQRNGIVPSMFPSGKNYADLTNNNHKSENGESVNAEDVVQPDDTISSIDDLEEEVSDLPLQRCMRIVPHDQNTGAFFIAVLHKVSHLPAIPDKSATSQGKLSTRSELHENLSDQATEEINGLEVSSVDGADEKISEVASKAEENISEMALEAADEKISEETSEVDEKISEVALEADLVDDEPAGGAPESNSSEAADKKTDSAKTGEKRKLQIQGKWKGVDPVLFFQDETIINSIKTFYGIDESFPFTGHLVTRNKDANHVKRIYYVSKSVKDVLDLNFRVGQQLKITSVGLKMFERQSSREGSSAPCSFRISSEGLPVILPYITKQILYASPADFKHLLQYKSIKFADFVDADFGQKAADLMLGCCVIVLREGDKSLSDHIQADASAIAIGCWKGRSSLSVMVTAMDCQELLERLSACMETEKKGTLAPESLGVLDKKQDMSGENGTPLEDQNVEAMKLQDTNASE
ncbi:tRNA (cytosine(34)-C(5))-methyltransferase-like isoform X1 [Gossypium australe]|uniref:tRNA (Cytosine(34)-C(5))-methyltransferase-like isoform X1 n=1 Tax=Gossypium australe TaxID=47621 RepID=A0A5B6UJ83_9ROSI|nr:tRNA (cytosine(34)-C(5))-methyltransferase-like isoform X1 [Gossypium australe]